MLSPSSRRKVRATLLVWEYFGFRRDGCFVEVGANDPIDGSQTWLLEQVGWSGVLVEPLPEKAAMLRAGRPGARVFEQAVGAPGQEGLRPFFVAAADVRSSLVPGVDHPGYRYERVLHVPVTSLDSVVGQANLGPIDLLTVDVEGTELDVLRGFDLERWRPKLILVEDKLRNLTKHAHLRQHGYRLVKRTCQDNWYIPRESPFILTSPWERLLLFRKVFLGTPLRRRRHRTSSSGPDPSRASLAAGHGNGDVADTRPGSPPPPGNPVGDAR